MEKLLINIALATAIFEERKNYLDTYHPFILKTFINNKFCKIDEISKNLNASFDLSLPIHSIKNILKRKENNIYKINKNYGSTWEINLTEKGTTELNELNIEEKKIETKLSSFYYNFKEFSERNFKKNYNLDKVEDLIKKFIKQNIIDISVQSDIKQIHDQHREFDKHFILFLSHIKKTNTELTEVFDMLWKGTVIWNELKKEDLQQVTLEFEKTIDVYVDTNFIFSLLGFHNPLINRAATELYNLIKSTNNIDLYVLDVTIKEIWSLLDLYPQFKDDYYDIEVDSVFYYLKKNNFSLTQVEKLKDDLIDKLNSEYGISYCETNVLDEKTQQWYSEIYEHLFKIRTEINERKPQKLHKTTNAIEKNAHHDTSAILHILSDKNRAAKNFENCKAIFLTSGFWLYKNYRNIHSKFEGFPSIILDSVLTNILYLKNPKVNTGISIDQVIKTHCNYLIIDHKIWTLFISCAKELVKNNKINIEDYTRLVSKNQMSEDALVDLSLNEINHEKVLELLEKIKEDENRKKEHINDYKAELEIKDKTIDSLTKRVALLEKQSHAVALKEYKSNLQKYIDDEWLIEKWKIKKSILWYFIFILSSLIIFSFAYFFNLDSDKVQSEYGFSASTIRIIGFILAGLVFIVPFIRSFFNHSNIIDGIKMISKKHRDKKKTEFTTVKIGQYKTKNPEPKIEYFINL